MENIYHTIRGRTKSPRTLEPNSKDPYRLQNLRCWQEAKRKYSNYYSNLFAVVLLLGSQAPLVLLCSLCSFSWFLVFLFFVLRVFFVCFGSLVLSFFCFWFMMFLFLFLLSLLLLLPSFLLVAKTPAEARFTFTTWSSLNNIYFNCAGWDKEQRATRVSKKGTQKKM